MTELLTVGVPGRTDRGVITAWEFELDDRTIEARDVLELLLAGAPVAIGVSGGKDSCACAIATIEYLDAIGHTGPRVLVHSDLGSVEWADSGPTCERLAAFVHCELITTRREKGGMMERWEQRWADNSNRYAKLSCVKLILPWSTPDMRFCTSELKTAVICRELIRRFPGQTIISACGVRRSESTNREDAPTAKPQPKLTSKTKRTTGIDWLPIAHWNVRDVYAFLAARGFELHEGYTRYGMTRISCAFCIMASAADLAASATCSDNAAIYRRMVDLEILSAFAFRGDGWLGDLAPHLLSTEQLTGLELAKVRAVKREVIEERIPEHLYYVKGWPTVMPTLKEAELLAEVRRAVSEICGFEIGLTDAASILARYAELMALNAKRDAAKAARVVRRKRKAMKPS